MASLSIEARQRTGSKTTWGPPDVGGGKLHRTVVGHAAGHRRARGARSLRWQAAWLGPAERSARASGQASPRSPPGGVSGESRQARVRRRRVRRRSHPTRRARCRYVAAGRAGRRGVELLRRARTADENGAPSRRSRADGRAAARNRGGRGLEHLSAPKARGGINPPSAQRAQLLLFFFFLRSLGSPPPRGGAPGRA